MTHCVNTLDLPTCDVYHNGSENIYLPADGWLQQVPVWLVGTDRFSFRAVPCPGDVAQIYWTEIPGRKLELRSGEQWGRFRYRVTDSSKGCGPAQTDHCRPSAYEQRDQVMAPVHGSQSGWLLFLATRRRFVSPAHTCTDKQAETLDHATESDHGDSPGTSSPSPNPHLPHSPAHTCTDKQTETLEYATESDHGDSPGTSSPSTISYSSRQKSRVDSEMWTLPGSPVDSMVLASVTSLLHTSNLKRTVPTIPHSTVPVCTPTRMFTWPGKDSGLTKTI
ncbi:hypothetical protein RRG08_052131 [Elysia crispata]|uniref:Uncharacterized protein n=1 Tax=Elysia crispata TaxID=231223 RepID=A0AAE1A448_9GAST|nr:hypothetical protein RRG08_052131 [Elysia crispata]